MKTPLPSRRIRLSRTRLLACAAVALFATTAAAQDPNPVPPAWETTEGADHPLVGRIFRPGLPNTLTPAEALDRLAGASFILLGEKHDNPDHHRLQGWVAENLIARGRRPALVLEMITADRVEALANVARDRPGDAAALAEAVRWNESGWPDFAQYRPAVAATLAAGLPVVAGNLAPAMVRTLSRKGIEAMEPDQRHRLGLDLPLSPDMAHGLAQQIRAGHCNLLPEHAVGAMVHVQRARDGSLAAAMADLGPGTDGAVLIAGAGHVRTDWGVPVHLAALAPQRTTLALAFLEVSDDAPLGDDATLAAYVARLGTSAPFDMVWFTPRAAAVEDPCVGLAHRLRDKEKQEKKQEEEAGKTP